MPYDKVLSQIHTLLEPKTYFEIGTLTGATLARANCASIAVDPAFQLSSDIVGKKSVCHLYQMKSDDFFGRQNPSATFGGPIEFAFLDGLHFFEFLLRDFANTERRCKRNSIVALHDCVPVDEYVGRRNVRDTSQKASSRYPDWWAGDVWKVVLALRKYRPDLTIDVCDAPPTGLVLVTNLNPTSTKIQEHYQEMISTYRDVNLADYGIRKLHDDFALTSTDRFNSFEEVSKHYWL